MSDTEPAPGATAARSKQFLFRSGQTIRIQSRDNDKMGYGACWWKWSDETEWRPIKGTAGEKEQPPLQTMS